MLKELYRFLSPKFQNVFLEFKVDPQPRWGYGQPAHKELLKIISSYDDDYRQLLTIALSNIEIFQSIPKYDTTSSTTTPVWNSGWLPGLDIIMLYTLIAHYKPERYIEVGSGNTTKVAACAKKNEGLNMHLTSIDPQPRAEIDALVDTVVRQPFEQADLSIFEQLKENDVVFIDNSHRVLT